MLGREGAGSGRARAARPRHAASYPTTHGRLLSPGCVVAADSASRASRAAAVPRGPAAARIEGTLRAKARCRPASMRVLSPRHATGAAGVGRPPGAAGGVRPRRLRCFFTRVHFTHPLHPHHDAHSRPARARAGPPDRRRPVRGNAARAHGRRCRSLWGAPRGRDRRRSHQRACATRGSRAGAAPHPDPLLQARQARAAGVRPPARLGERSGGRGWPPSAARRAGGAGRAPGAPRRGGARRLGGWRGSRRPPPRHGAAGATSRPAAPEHARAHPRRPLPPPPPLFLQPTRAAVESSPTAATPAPPSSTAAGALAAGTEYELFLQKPLGIRFARGADGEAYVSSSDAALGATDACVQAGDKLLQVSASFGADVWDAKNFGCEGRRERRGRAGTPRARAPRAHTPCPARPPPPPQPSHVRHQDAQRGGVPQDPVRRGRHVRARPGAAVGHREAVQGRRVFLSFGALGRVLFSPTNAPEILTLDRKSTRLNSSHAQLSRMPSSA